MSSNDGGPAFPLSVKSDPAVISHGMTLRDYFAGQALVGICSAGRHVEYGPETQGNVTSREAYCLADAMLKERDRGG